MSEELEPCPFCGGKAKLMQTQYGKYFIRCENYNGCNVHPETIIYENYKSSIHVWNKRNKPVTNCHDLEDKND
jgi:ssDNA-binding Zn-finger/Zn-ribbon topoisomerase 1